MSKTDTLPLSSATSSPPAGWFFAFWALCLGLLLSPATALGQGSFEQFFQAIKANDVRAIQALQARGFDLNTRNEALDPPLVLALRDNALQVASYLITQPGMDLDARNSKDENALMLASIKGHLQQVRELIQHKAQVNKPGWTPLHYAASSTQEHSATIVALLLEHHAYIDASSPNGSTPLMLAAMYGDVRSVDVLLEAGADARLTNQIGLTAIDFAHRAGRGTVAEKIAASIRAAQPKGRW